MIGSTIAMHEADLTVSCRPAVMFAANWLIVAAYLVSALTDKVCCATCNQLRNDCFFFIVPQLLTKYMQVNGTGLSLVYSIKSFAQLVHQYHVFAKCYQC